MRDIITNDNIEVLDERKEFLLRQRDEYRKI